MTFSVAATCERTGEIGLALTTSSMAAGARAMLLVPGHGAIFAQARSDPRLPPLARAALEQGANAHQALEAMLAAGLSEWRQLAVLDANGQAAHATGAQCVASKAALSAPGALALGNSLANDAVVPAMLEALQANPQAPLLDRLLDALDAGLAAGGEPHPLRSAAIQIARPKIPFPILDLRVDLAGAPLKALRHQATHYAPLLEPYLARALDPAHAPLAAAVESHLRHPMTGD